MSTTQHIRDAAGRYRAYLRQSAAPVPRGGSHYAVFWSAPPFPSPDAVVDAVLAAEASPGRVLKQSRVNLSVRTCLLDREVVLKRFNLPRPYLRLKYRWRASRARRAWAAARTLADLGIGTPPPLGFIERSVRGWPAESYAITAYSPDAQPARRWIKARLHRQSAAFRAAFAHDLLSTLLTLYRHRIYHADTKTNNLLLVAPDHPQERRFRWIDLECVQFGVRPTRRRVLRNLVQLNGSVGSKLPDADRLAFLDQLAAEFPWADAPRVAETIRRRTLHRLQREIQGVCGP